MKKVAAEAWDCIVCECPYCKKDIIELNSNLSDWDGGDITEEAEITCPHCKKDFEYYIEE